jgi:hypothetical protein
MKTRLKSTMSPPPFCVCLQRSTISSAELDWTAERGPRAAYIPGNRDVCRQRSGLVVFLCIFVDFQFGRRRTSPGVESSAKQGGICLQRCRFSIGCRSRPLFCGGACGGRLRGAENSLVRRVGMNSSDHPHICCSGRRFPVPSWTGPAERGPRAQIWKKCDMRRLFGLKIPEIGWVVSRFPPFYVFSGKSRFQRR